MKGWRIAYRAPLPMGLAGLIAGFCWGALAGMVALRLMERLWQ